MSLLRAIFLIIALWVQALPASALVALTAGAAPKPEEKCEMSCCAWQRDQADEAACGCIEAPVSPLQQTPAPAQTPPAAGRDIVPAPLWTALSLDFHLPEIPAAESPAPWPASLDEKPQPHVRLAVLFCSFLT